VETSSRPHFFGGDRFEVVRRLGVGGMGIVYQVRDRERSRTVALKTLHHGDVSALYMLKHEFRALADIVHPNLVTLYELIASDHESFFTMELIDGVDFITWVREDRVEKEFAEIEGAVTEPTRPRPRRGLAPAGSGTDRDGGPDLPPLDPSPPASYERLRDGLRQLAEGVAVLHESDKLHRDIKPSNVMVDRNGRVVLLDFGLIADVAVRDGGTSDALPLAGTLEYMSPEQGASLPIGPASDWYSVGTILFQGLTGALPFRGAPVSILLEKQWREPEPPRALVPETPPDLSQLCWELLRKDPRARPGGDEILERLGRRPAPSPTLRRRSRDSIWPDVPLVGRSAHVTAIRTAFDVVTGTGRAMTVLVRGRSGMGKSILIERVTRTLAREREALVLAARCHERESIPYKALDGVIDALSRYMAALPGKEAALLVPREVKAVTRLFPVLRRVDAIAAATREFTTSDPHELRRRGLAALRELLSRVGERRPLVLAVDDFQWGDLDSTRLLLDLLRPPNPPVLLLIVAYRTEEAEESEAVRHLLERLGARGLEARDVRELEVGALDPDEARELARALLRRGEDRGPLAADALARESGGDPFLIDQLTRWLHEYGGQDVDVSFTQVMRHQLGELAPDARRALELIAVSGQPVRQQAVARAAGLEQMDPVLPVLRSQSLVRRSGAREMELVEIYHDRIREAVLATLSDAQLRACHLALGDAIEATDRRDSEALALHLLAAGAVERGVEYAIEAARKASAALAFERAIFFYRRAIDALPPAEVSRRRLRVALGEALVNAGRGVDAAAEYMAAAEALPAAEALEFRRRAAEQLLHCGHVDEGIRALQNVLEAVGMKVARTPRRALWSLIRRRMRVRMRGLRFVEREATQVSPELLRKVDICWTATAGIGPVDPIRGLDCQSQHLLLALEAGEPYRIARALAMEACFSAFGGRATRSRTEKLLALAGKTADRVGEPHARGLVAFASGLAEYHLGLWHSARPRFVEAAGTWREYCTGVADQIAVALRFELDTMFHVGSLRELCRRVPAYLAEEERRGDLFGVYGMRTGFPNAVWLVVDDPETAQSECERGANSLSLLLDFSLEHYLEVMARTHIDLYRGNHSASHRRVSALWPRLKRSKLLRIQWLRADALFLRGRAALAAASAGSKESERTRFLAEVDRARRQLEQQPFLGASAQANLLAAGQARVRGDIEGAVQSLTDAESGFRGNHMVQYAAAMRHRRGELVGGAAGEELRADAEREMRTESVRNPSAWTRLFAPF
jgi:eukaryotic-like serine/threonine-protein kinase